MRKVSSAELINRDAYRWGAFYYGMHKIGFAIHKNELPEISTPLAIEIIRDLKDLTEEEAIKFLNGEYGEAFALCVLSKFPKGEDPKLITEAQLRNCVIDTVMSWRFWQ